jgi:hypothetical protein
MFSLLAETFCDITYTMLLSPIRLHFLEIFPNAELQPHAPPPPFPHSSSSSSSSSSVGGVNNHVFSLGGPGQGFVLRVCALHLLLPAVQICDTLQGTITGTERRASRGSTLFSSLFPSSPLLKKQPQTPFKSPIPSFLCYPQSIALLSSCRMALARVCLRR